MLALDKLERLHDQQVNAVDQHLQHRVQIAVAGINDVTCKKAISSPERAACVHKKLESALEIATEADFAEKFDDQLSNLAALVVKG